MRTCYCVRIRDRVEGSEVSRSFDSMTARNIFIFSLGLNVDVIKEWEESR